MLPTPCARALVTGASAGLGSFLAGNAGMITTVAMVAVAVPLLALTAGTILPAGAGGPWRLAAMLPAILIPFAYVYFIIYVSTNETNLVWNRTQVAGNRFAVKPSNEGCESAVQAGIHGRTDPVLGHGRHCRLSAGRFV